MNNLIFLGNVCKDNLFFLKCKEKKQKTNGTI